MTKWKLVPVEPTITMAENGSLRSDYDLSQDRCRQVWQAMLSAAPPPLTDRERVLLDYLIQYWQDYAKQCDSIANRKMAVRQKGWGLERVALLKKLAGIN